MKKKGFPSYLAGFDGLVHLVRVGCDGDEVPAAEKAVKAVDGKHTKKREEKDIRKRHIQHTR